MEVEAEFSGGARRAGLKKTIPLFACFSLNSKAPQSFLKMISVHRQVDVEHVLFQGSRSQVMKSLKVSTCNMNGTEEQTESQDSSLSISTVLMKVPLTDSVKLTSS